VRDRERAGGGAQAGRVLTGRGAEQPAVLAAELGGAVVADQVPDAGHVLVPWSPLRNGFLSGKYQRGRQVTDSARSAHVGGPSDDDYAVIDTVAAVAGQRARLDEVSAPVLNYPAPMHGPQRAMLQFAGTTVDGESSAVYPPLLESDVRY
jgi:aryl-alcohol dehydrogenase (NADP+)